MALTFANGLIMILSAASMLTESMANWGWYNGFNNTNSRPYGVRKMVPITPIIQVMMMVPIRSLWVVLITGTLASTIASGPSKMLPFT
ncbi:hypothetical protein WN943_024494 [Citrus x changshan-huyou]